MFQSLFYGSNGEFQTFIDSMTDAIYVMEVEVDCFRYVSVNKEGIELAGITKEIIGKKIDDVVPKVKSDILISHYRKVLKQKESLRFEFESRPGKYEESILTPIMNDNNDIVFIVTITRDITHRKVAEMEKEKKEKEYASLIELNSDGIYTLDNQGNVRDVNDALVKLTGYSKAELKSGSLYTKLYGQYADEIDRKTSEGESHEFELQLTTKQGELLDCTVKKVPMVVDDKMAGVYGVIKNISREKKMMKAIKNSEERYSKLIEESPDAMMIYCDGVVKFANRAAAKLFGAPSREVFDGKSVYDFFPLVNRAAVKNEIDQLYAINPIQRLTEARIITLDGTEKYIEVSSVKTDYKGMPGVHSIMRDISVRKKMEEAVVKSEERYRLIAENSRDLIQLVTPSGKLAYVSPSHPRVLGYHVDELRGNNIEKIVQEEDISRFKEELDLVIKTKLHRSIEVKVNHYNKQWIWVHVDLIPIKDDEDEIINVLFVGEDITKRKDYEAKIHHLAYHDALTGLPNRINMDNHIEEAIKLKKEKTKHFAVMFLDCDNFKRINDQWGHDAGDEFLKDLANRLTNCVREKDVVSRIGGDEFTILIKDIDNQELVTIIVERIIQCMENPYTYQKDNFLVTLSVGIVTSYGEDDKKSLLKKADQALYTAKHKGKNMYCWG
ncbi:PAS domain S-box protein [Salipaludibacillus sp. HK11]|uniref:PAS domain S-box protein n=1 Tax=Salipaludibacillus sp. HK11 TaxID=3394320 RepID=UPI0039FDC77C